MKERIISAALLTGIFVAWNFRCLRAVEPEEPSLASKVSRLILPEVSDTAGLTVAEAVGQLRVKTRDIDAASQERGQDINLVLISGGGTKLPGSQSRALMFRDVPFVEALRRLTEQAGMQYRVDTHAVVITTRGARFPQQQREAFLPYMLSKRIISAVSWQDCSLEEAVESLQSNWANGRGDRDYQGPLNIVLHVRHNAQRPPLSLDLRNVPMSEVLRYMAEMSGLKISTRSRAIVFSDHDLGLPPEPPAKPSPVEVRAKQMILRRVIFQGTTLAEAVEFLNIKTRELDPDQQGVRIVARPAGGDDPIITFDLNEVVVEDVLDHLALQSGRRLSVEGDSFVLTPMEGGR